MKSIILHQPGEFRTARSPPPPLPKPGEALVRVRRIGVCGTDFHAFRGVQPFFTYPRVLGHELAVQVEATSDNSGDLKPGDWCAVRPYLECGQCLACQSGKPNCCERLSVLGVHADGGMRECLTVPVRALHPSSALTPDQLALVEPLGIGAHAVRRAALALGEHVLVIGAGPIGLATIQFALAAGASVLVLDTNPQRLAFCQAQLKAARCLDPSQDALEQISTLTNNDLPTAVFDCTGSAASMSAALHFAAHGGRLIYVGIVQADIALHDPLFHRRELTLLASRNATREDFDRVISAIASGAIDVQPWITHRCPFEAFLDEFPRWTQPETGVVKALVEF